MKSERKEKSTGRYEIDIVPNEFGGWYARVSDFPTIFTGGKTPVEAMENALEAIDLMIDELRERNMPIPEPKSRFSGHFNIRVPRELHRELSQRAESEGVSLNALIAYFLSRAVRPDTKTHPRGIRSRRGGLKTTL